MTVASSQPDNPDALCRKRYRVLAAECKIRGLRPREVERSKGELNLRVGDVCYLVEAAYKPTGVALGCPLPDRRFTRKLWRLSRLAEKFLLRLSPRGPTFAHVPPDWYHTTLVNCTHFDDSAHSPMRGGAHLLSDEAWLSARDVTSQVAEGPLAVEFNGLILTSAGRLIVPGFPVNERLYKLRHRLREGVPQLRVNTPRTVHVKVGHVLVDPGKDGLKAFLAWLALCGQHVNARVSFGDLYTPAGRITL